MRRMPRLGRSVHVILGLAIAVLVVIYGGMELWPRVESYWRMRELDRRWRDPSLPAAERGRAVERLAEFGPDAAPYLLAAAHDADGRVRAQAYLYLSGLEPVPEEAVQICVAALKDDRVPGARASAAGSLGLVAYIDRDRRVDRRRRIIESLVAAGRDRSPVVRCAAVRAMVGANAVSVDPSPWLEDSDPLVRLAAAEAILWLDPANKGRIVPTLQAMILQANPGRPGDVIRPMALLLQADPSAGRPLVPTFVAWFGREDPAVRTLVLECFLRLGPAARDAIPALEARLDRSQPAERARVALAIVMIEPAACERAAIVLCAMLRDAALHPRERVMALAPLGAMLHRAGVPGRVRDRVDTTLRAVPEDRATHPELAGRVRQLLDYQQGPPAGMVTRDTGIQ
jgi:HEAT repeat protein